MSSSTATPTGVKIEPGTRLRFDGKSTSWLVRAVSEDGRYALTTASFFGEVSYSVIDHQEQIRGPINVLGQGMGIFTTTGHDPQIDETMKMLRPYPADYMDGYPNGRPVDVDDMYGFEVSHRNRVPLNITGARADGAEVWS